MKSNVKPLKVDRTVLVATQWSTVEEKAKATEELSKFLIARADPKKWTPRLYKALEQHFSHIAHYNQAGFYGVWFESAAKRLEFAKYHAERSIYGDPAWTWSDVERQFQKWVRESGILDELQFEATEAELAAIEQAEAALAERRLQLLGTHK